MTNLRAALRHHLASTACAVLLVTPALAGAADKLPLPEPNASQSVEIKGARVRTVEQVQRKAVDNARAAAVADGVSTALALSSGAIELNPLVATSPLGLLALTGAKIGLVNFARTLPEHERRTVLKASGAIWGGAAINNLLVLMAAPTPVAVLAGVVVGVLSWRHTARAYAAADRALAEAGGVTPLPEPSEQAETVEVAWVPVAPDEFYALR